MPEDRNRENQRRRSRRAQAFDRFTVYAFGAVLLVAAVLTSIWISTTIKIPPR